MKNLIPFALAACVLGSLAGVMMARAAGQYQSPKVSRTIPGVYVYFRRVRLANGTVQTLSSPEPFKPTDENVLQEWGEVVEPVGEMKFYHTHGPN